MQNILSEIWLGSQIHLQNRKSSFPKTEMFYSKVIALVWVYRVSGSKFEKHLLCFEGNKCYFQIYSMCSLIFQYLLTHFQLSVASRHIKHLEETEEPNDQKNKQEVAQPK